MRNLKSPVANVTRTVEVNSASREKLPDLLRKQWLVTNGLGGFASGTISGAVTWRYHGLLIAALPAPFGRTLMLNHLTECLRLPDGRVIEFGGAEQHQSEEAAETHLRKFWLENQLPCWLYEIEGLLLEKRILMRHLQNTVQISYTLQSEHQGVALELRPAVHFRQFEADVSQVAGADYELRVVESRFEVRSRGGYPPLRLQVHGQKARFINDGGSCREIFYQRDAERGYEARGSLWSPGYFSIPLPLSKAVTLVGSTEDWGTIAALQPDSASEIESTRRERLLRIAHPKSQGGPAAELVLAADQFIVTPVGRVESAARARAAGDELRSIIAGYHWFTDWGRDTMISLEGLTMMTGRCHEAEWVLKTFANAVRDGLIPNLYPEGRDEGLYHTADATMWFFHAVSRYVMHTQDRETLAVLLPVLRDIVAHHFRGTHFGIGVDPADGLLRQGEAGYQLTWMDAKVGDWVVTPRRGKAVEINALWYNALCLLTDWLQETGDAAGASSLREQARRVRESFNQRFWNPTCQCLFDVLDGEDGNDPAIRPNQIFALSLTYPVLEREHWQPVLQVVREKLLTPVGLRSLSREHPDYKAKYFGDLRARDAAYHQGTVWGWLIGPFIDAWLKVYPEKRSEARDLLDGFLPHLAEGCVGSISEVFDAEPPYTDRGCIAQAWSVAELLRALVLTTGESEAA